MVCVNRKDQIKLIAEDAALDQFAVLTADDEMNGIATAKVDDARVLFTTQQMVEARCEPMQLKVAGETGAPYGEKTRSVCCSATYSSGPAGRQGSATIETQIAKGGSVGATVGSGPEGQTVGVGGKFTY